MATGQIARPGVTVLQSFKKASPTFIRPTLAPVVVGPAFEVINILTSDGTINAKAKYGAYEQLGRTITQSAFPDHRGNVDELDIQESTIRPFILAGGKLSELLMNPGEGFLTAHHGASKAAFKFAVAGGGVDVGSKTLVIAVDQPARLNTSQDITVVFSGSGLRSPDQIVADINAAAGQTIASKILDTNGSYTGYCQLASTVYGVKSSVTVRAGGSANSALGLGYATGAAHEERIEGSGFRAQSQSNNSTQSPWIEFYRGDYLVDGVTTAFVNDKTGLINVETETLVFAKAAAVTFGDAGTIPLKVGDYFIVDGIRVNGSEVMKVESTRFKLGTINTALSTSDENGRYTAKVYEASNVGTLLDTNVFAPAYTYFTATGLYKNIVSPQAATLTGTVAGAAAISASVTSGPISFPATIAGLTLHLVVTAGASVVDKIYTFTGGPYADIAALVSAVDALVSADGVVASNDSGNLKLATDTNGHDRVLVVKSDGTANTALAFDAIIDSTGTGKDIEISELSTKTFSFTLDKNPHVYSVAFSNDSVEQAADLINQTVGGTVASVDNSRHLVLTSTLKGLGSQVKVLSGTGLVTLGFTAEQTDAGSGRPYPDAYLDDVNNLVLGSQILRDQVTGFPLDQDKNLSTVYIQFKALRKDVSPLAQSAGILRMPDVDTLSATLDPVTEENPLSLGMFLAMLNAPGFEVKGLGVDEVTGAAPEGTELAYARAANMLEAEEVYAIAPLTHNEVVHSAFATHVTLMSAPEQGGERVVLINKVMPREKNAVLAASGSSANSTATANQLLLDSSPVPGLVEAGINTALPLTPVDGVYVEFAWDSVVYKYNVSSVDGAVLNLNVSFTGNDNADGFFSTSALPSNIVNAAWVVKVRGDSLVIPGSNPERLDYSLVADSVSEANAAIGNRRVFSVFPDNVKMTIAGIDKSIPGYYACAAVAGMIAGQPPQQGFTNFPVAGITGVIGTEKFTRKQLNTMAGGGTYVLMQEVVGGPVFSRHQLSTDVTNVESREMSITKVVDFSGKFLRLGVRRFIGRQNISEVFLDTIGTAVQGMLQFLTENGVLNGAHLNNIIQDKTSPDTVLVDVTLDVPFPCNYIRLTLVV